MNQEYVGDATPSQRMKALYRVEGRGLSLKAFARKCLKDNNPDLSALAKAWFKNKGPQGQTQRSAANAALAKTIGAAVKNSRRATKK